MFRKAILNYVQIFRTTRLISLIVTLLLIFVSLWSLVELVYPSLLYADDAFLRENEKDLAIGIIFHIFISAVFLFRLIALLKLTDRRIWLSQIAWILGLVVLYAYIVVTRGSLFEDPNSPTIGCMDCFYFSTFRYASPTFTVVFLLYPLLSVFKEIVLGIWAFEQALSSKIES